MTTLKQWLQAPLVPLPGCSGHALDPSRGPCSSRCSYCGCASLEAAALATRGGKAKFEE